MNKKKKMGRPRIPKNKAKGTLIGARFSPPEVKQITASVKRSKMNKSAWIRTVLLSPSEQMPSINCPNAFERYDGKSVVFQIEMEEEMVLHSGAFRVLREHGKIYVCIHAPKLRYPFDPPNTFGHSLFLSQVHVDSIAPANDPQKEIDFAVKVPFLRRHYMRGN